MKTMEWRTIDKSDWPRGQWDDEPDKMQWQDEATGLPCLIVRGPAGALCGYVGVGPTHPWFGIGYSECPSVCEDVYCDHSPGAAVRCHGGLTFSDKCDEEASEGRGICHIAEPGDFEPAWWFGFDCGHSCDLIPSHREWGAWFPSATYKGVAYVRGQVTELARQIAEVR